MLTTIRKLQQTARAIVRHDDADTDPETDAALIDAVLQSLLFCLALLALVTCLARLPIPQPSPMAPDTARQMLMMGNFAG